MTDLVIEDAKIVDGTGAPWFRGAVGVTDHEISEIYRNTDPDIDATTVNADGRVVCPGFIDTHSHSDIELFDNPTLAPKVRQGITTEILGQDGFSMAPMYREGGAEEWSKQLGALAGQTDIAWSWGSVGDYLDAVEESGVAPNAALLVGHGTVRFNVLGMDSRDPTDEELEEMADLVTEALEDGAAGFSTGLIYTPCTYAGTHEVQELAARLGSYGRPFVAHIRSEGRWIWNAFDEFIDIGAEEGIPLHLSHFKMGGPEQHGKVNRATSLIEAARERGVDFTAEQYPYTAGSTMLSAVLPPWVHAAGPKGTLEYLTDDDARERIRQDITEWRITGWENIGALSGWDNVVIANVESEENTEVEGASIAEIANDRDTEPVDVVCELLVEEELSVSITLHMLDENDVQEIFSYERVCVGTDGLFGGKPHPRVYGTYPRILGTYVREKNLLTLEEAIRKMTSLPARAMGLDHKGVIRPGMDADLIVFDPVQVESRATFENPRRYPKGIDYVLVNGEFAVREGEMTENLPGRAIRK
ncbi:N-acyl-D-amino acid deacylase [Haladaptatus sp. W1]|uniref:N-acyl-D-amino-acid deacylase family protein n=1 Tax=Haladaptatus sp. W1 TaxID=1897478 RepID=UPI0008498F17|nr:D-aminoacylase [Haladaptatus sp. W1]ODR80243.1 N-acyl-D-amino acid deacylase [Haladaptatus sp. W1]